MRNTLALLVAVVLVALVAGCSTTNKSLLYAKAAPDGVEGMRVEGDGGSFSGGVNLKLENVGEFVKIPSLYKGAVPPGWVVYEGPPPTPEEPETDEEPTPSPPPG